jgi:hypothetical protein
MSVGTFKRIAGPAFLASSVANIYTPPASTIYTILRHIHLANVTGGAVTFTLYVGATGGSAAGTQLFTAVSIPANSVYDWYGTLRMDSTDFLTGLASAGSSITITVEGEQAVV